MASDSPMLTAVVSGVVSAGIAAIAMLFAARQKRNDDTRLAGDVDREKREQAERLALEEKAGRVDGNVWRLIDQMDERAKMQDARIARLEAEIVALRETEMHLLQENRELRETNDRQQREITVLRTRLDAVQRQSP